VLLQDYFTWFAARSPSTPFVFTPAPGPDSSVQTNWAPGAFRCNPFGCKEVCCLTSHLPGGVPLYVADLLRLQEGGLLDSVCSRFSPSETFREFVAAPSDATFPDFPHLRTREDHCVHYDSESRGCKIYEHRPYICRSFPYSARYDSLTGTIEARMSERCSLAKALVQIRPLSDASTPEPPRATAEASLPDPMPPPAAAQDRYCTTLGGLPEYDRQHLEACLARDAEGLRTVYLVMDRPDLVDELGLGEFLAPVSNPDRSQATDGR
jgi:Fe-S-cluster containining protein